MSQTVTTPIAATIDEERPSVALAIPMHTDPDWSLFDALPEDVPLIVVDDSDGNLAPPPRANVRYFDYAAQRDYLGEDHYAAIPHKSAATRNFGHVVAYREGYDVVLALDYDCRPRAGWLEDHLGRLGAVTDAPALRGDWINTVAAPGFYARGYPYEYRNPEASHVVETTVSGHVKLNMGVWDNVLDLNGIDKLQASPPDEPGLHAHDNLVALGNVPICGMNVAFAAELVPAYYFLPDMWVNGSWQLSRHDDIWGGYLLKRLMDVRGDLLAFGRPVVEHTRQSSMERVLVFEQWMHLMSDPFYRLVDEAVGDVSAGPYDRMFAAFVEGYRRRASTWQVPHHYREVYEELGAAMERWVRVFA